MIDYKIISTGSKGNAVIIDGKIMIDCGIPFRALKDVYKQLQLVLLTHSHTDHFNSTTICRLARERPTLRWGIPEWLAHDMLDLAKPDKIDIITFDDAMFYGDFIVQAVPLVHNVPNCGYKICLDICGERKHMFYATDTNSMDGISAPNYDLYMIEANYTVDEITERIRRKTENGEYCYEWDALKNHLSKEKADEWLYSNMGANSNYVYLHKHTD